MRDLEVAIGQYALYYSSLARVEEDHKLYLAVPRRVFRTVMEEPIARCALEDWRVALIAYDPEKEVITQWKTP
jgi:hypothetical protein